MPDRPVRSLRAGTPRAGRPEVVVVPGLGALGYLVPLAKACAEWTRVHLLDVPGFGHRVTARLPATLTATARTTAQWLRAAGGGPVILVGHSTGAQSALRAAVAVPDRVQGLCMAGPPFPPTGRRWPSLALRVARTVPHEHPGLIPAVAPEYLRGRLRILTLLRSAMADTPEHTIGQVRRPVVVVRGGRDATCPQWWAQQLASAASRGDWRVLPGAHNFPFTDPTATSAVIRSLS